MSKRVMIETKHEITKIKTIQKEIKQLKKLLLKSI